MSKRRKLVILLACGIMLAVLAWFVCRAPEPSYNGRSLSQWVIRAGQEPDVDQETRRALTAIGTNAVPYLVKWIQYQRPLGKRILIRLANNISRTIWGKRIVSDEADSRAWGVQNAFKILGPSARDAVQDLGRIANGPAALSSNPEASMVADRAASCLTWLGEEAVPPLLAVLTNGQNRVREVAALSLADMGTNAVPAIPALIYCLSDTNSPVAVAAASALGQLRLDSTHVVPALIRHMQHSDKEVRFRCAEALGDFGSEATAAVPELIKATSDSDKRIRDAATDAIRKIAPEVLTNTPAK